MSTYIHEFNSLPAQASEKFCEREISLALQCHKMVPSTATHMYIPQVTKSTWLHVEEKKGVENLRVASRTQIQEFSAVLP